MKNLLTCYLFFLSLFSLSSQTSIPDSLKGTALEKLINDIVKEKVDATKKKSKSTAKTHILRTALDFHGTISEGNVNRRLASIGGEIEYGTKNSILEYSIAPQYSYGTQNAVLREDDFITRIGFNIFSPNRVYILGFGSIQTSHLRRISLRNEGGAGIGFRFFKKSKTVKFSITNAIIYDNTNFVDEESLDIETMSLSTRFKGEYKFGKHFKIKHIIFVQPSLLDGDYFRFIGNVSFKYKFKKNLDFNILVTDTYESIVAEGKVNNDFNILFGFSLHTF